MKPRLLIIGIALVLAVAFVAWWLSPKQAVKRRTNSLLQTLTLDAGTGKLSRHAGEYRLDALLAPQVELENPSIAEANGTFDRGEMTAAYSWLCDQAKQTRFKTGDLHSITINGDQAKVEISLTALVELPTYNPADGSFEVVFDWVKSEDGWRLRKAVWRQK